MKSKMKTEPMHQYHSYKITCAVRLRSACSSAEIDQYLQGPWIAIELILNFHWEYMIFKWFALAQNCISLNHNKIIYNQSSFIPMMTRIK